MLTSKPNDKLVLPAIRAGALSYLLKDVSTAELAAAICDALGKLGLRDLTQLVVYAVQNKLVE
ncbi:MAG: hypothetical protein K6U03_02450 [Firmicutes bacterium]|nr:hypothetical protein [Bacillota bacterium]